MRWSIACVSASLLVCIASAGCERAETPTTAGGTAPAPESQTSNESQQSSSASLNATLSGAEEVPGPGDPDGSGSARITIDAQKGELCYELSAENIQTANAAHVHTGAAGAAGPPVVALEAPAQGTSKGCASAEAQVLQDIAQNPANFYVNVHNEEFPPGAIRGQLGR